MEPTTAAGRSPPRYAALHQALGPGHNEARLMANSAAFEVSIRNIDHFPLEAPAEEIATATCKFLGRKQAERTAAE